MATDLNPTTLTTPYPHALFVGDKLRINGIPNSIRTFVSEVISQTEVAIRQIRRPSRGYARHIRHRINANA